VKVLIAAGRGDQEAQSRLVPPDKDRGDLGRVHGALLFYLTEYPFVAGAFQVNDLVDYLVEKCVIKPDDYDCEGPPPVQEPQILSLYAISGPIVLRHQCLA